MKRERACFAFHIYYYRAQCHNLADFTLNPPAMKAGTFCICRYDDQLDRITKYQRILLDDLTLIEFGVPEHGGTVLLFKQTSKTEHHCIRLNYKVASVSGYYHMFRSTNLRFFNNLAVGIKTHEEMIGMDGCHMFYIFVHCLRKIV